MSTVNYNAATVKQEVDIVKLAGEYTRLRQVGSSGRYIGLCPFHQEKTPSFNVNQARQFYKCFGCGAGGDVFDFTMLAGGITFTQAVNLLGERYGIGPAKPWTPADRWAYAQEVGLAQRLSDFATGLRIAVEQPTTKLTPVLLGFGIDPAETLHHLHAHLHLLRCATPRDIGATWREMRMQDASAVDAVERLGRHDREQAEAITHTVVELLAASQAKERAA